MEIIFSQIYPGSNQTLITEKKTDAISWVVEEHEIVSEKVLNMPGQKNNPVFRS